MTGAQSIKSWTEANQAYLVAEFASLAQRLTPAGDRPSNDGTTAQQEAARIRSSLQPPPAIDQLSGLFALTDFECQLLLLCAGVEMDSRLAERCAEAQGRSGRTNATFGLAMACLPDSHWSALTPSRPLRRLRMLEVQAGA